MTGKSHGSEKTHNVPECLGEPRRTVRTAPPRADGNTESCRRPSDPCRSVAPSFYFRAGIGGRLFGLTAESPTSAAKARNSASASGAPSLSARMYQDAAEDGSPRTPLSVSARGKPGRRFGPAEAPQAHSHRL